MKKERYNNLYIDMQAGKETARYDSDVIIKGIYFNKALCKKNALS